MTKRTCTEQDCTAPHLARGYCRKHYRAHGFDSNQGKKLYRTAVCTCCGKGFSRWANNPSRMQSCSDACARILSGQASAARRATFPASKIFVRTCSWCEITFIARHGRVALCSAECKRVSALSTQHVAELTPCMDCGADAVRWNKYCAECRAIRVRDARNMAKHVRRARIRGTATETVKPRAIYARDGYMCGICHDPVDMALTYPSPRSHSLDHIVPLAHGGTHTIDNVQLAHLRCNSIKRDLMPSEMALIA